MRSYLYDILVSPLLSEKAVAANESGKYAFKVSPDANKYLVKSAIQEIFKVEPKKVSIISMPSKKKKFKGTNGVRSGYKKAVVTLSAGSVIDLNSI